MLATSLDEARHRSLTVGGFEGRIVELRVLGPVEVHAGGRVLGPGRPQQQVVLAVLAADAGRLVSVDALVDRVSGPAPPARASQLLHTHITRIRRLLEQAEAAGGDPVRVARRAGGYVLEIPPHRVDLHRFQQLVARAGDGARPNRDRAGLLREALDLWRGEPLAGLSGPWVEVTRQAWRQQRLAAVLSWARSGLAAGDPAVVVDPLLRELAEHPLVEPLAELLMRALAASGRSAEALACYDTVRRRLADELGTDPGPELQAAHRAILRGELTGAGGGRAGGSASAAASGPVAAGTARSGVPAQVPADVPAFTGRARELEQLDTLVDSAAVAVSGTAGVGKTALAIRWAHRAAGRFPDGQLYVNLRGFDPDQPMPPGDALARLLTALGVADRDIPPELDERAARYRSELAGCRMLVVLDNAAGSEQVRPLLPGAGPAAALVTSRDSLAGLVAVDGVHRLDLDLLPADDALALLRRLIGHRVAAEPAATTALVGRCVRLPLALRVAAELVATRPTTPLAELVAELADRQQRLDLLDAGGDPRAAVAAVFSWSVQHLPPAAARAFRLIGGHPGGDLDGYALAALAGLDLASARRILDRLARAHLVHPTGAAHRYGIHDLLRAYAASLAGEEARPALGRLFDYYLDTAATAIDRLHPAEAGRRPKVPPAATPTPELADPEAAKHWLDAERSTLVAVAAHAAGHGWPTYTIRLSAILYRYFDGGYHADALAVHGHAHRAAEQAGDLAGQAQALRGLGAAHMRLGRFEAAAEHHRQALAAYRRAGDPVGEALALNNLGLVEVMRCRYGAAAEHHLRALALSRQAGDPTTEAIALNGLGMVNQRLGRYGPAVHHHERSLAVARRAGNLMSEAIALDNLGVVEQWLGRYGVAAEHHRRALALTRRLGNRTGEAHVLDNLGTCHLHLGEPARAVEYFTRSLTIFREIGDREGQTWALNGLGEAAVAAGHPADARTHHTAALSVAADIGAATQQARAHIGLGQAHERLADPVQARHHLEQALSIYIDLESPEADQLRERLGALAGD